MIVTNQCLTIGKAISVLGESLSGCVGMSMGVVRQSFKSIMTTESRGQAEKEHRGLEFASWLLPPLSSQRGHTFNAPPLKMSICAGVAAEPPPPRSHAQKRSSMRNRSPMEKHDGPGKGQWAASSFMASCPIRAALTMVCEDEEPCTILVCIPGQLGFPLPVRGRRDGSNLTFRCLPNKYSVGNLFF